MRRLRFALPAALLTFAAASRAEPVRYTLDPTHTFPALEFPHMRISTWRGRFNETSGNLVLDLEAKSGEVQVGSPGTELEFAL